MLKYNINITLDINDNISDKKFTIDDMNEQTINIINVVYKKDFKLFSPRVKINICMLIYRIT